MDFSLTKILKVCIFLVVVMLIISAANEEVEARKRGKKKHRGKGKRKGRKHRNPRRDMRIQDTDVAHFHQQEINLEEFMKQQKAFVPPPTPTQRTNSEPDQWVEALLSVKSENSVMPFAPVAKGKFGHHSKKETVIGKVVHVKDPNMKTHYGCNGAIGNLFQIPKNETWIALIERGQCYFFHKIRLAKIHNASAVIIYNDRAEKIEVMNTVGTRTVSLMISKEDGRKISSLTHTTSSVIMMIRTGKTHNSSTISSSWEINEDSVKEEKGDNPVMLTDSMSTSPPTKQGGRKTVSPIDQAPASPPVTSGGEPLVTPTCGAVNLSVSSFKFFMLSALGVLYYLFTDT